MTAQPSGNAGTAVAALIRAANIELIPLRGAQEKLNVVPAGTRITITCSPKFGLGRTLEYAELAVKAGYEVVPHLAARQVAGKAELRDVVRRIDDLGITDLYVIGGDADEPAGGYREAAEILEDLAGLDHGLERIGVGCYPEGHPKISDDALLDALRRKQAYATYMVSQLCFDARALIRWLRATRTEGIELPLRVGLAAPLKTTRLMELSLKIGVDSSIRSLTKQHGFVGNLLVGGAYHPERLLYAIGDDMAAGDLNIEGLHLFSFNQVDITAAWQKRFSAVLPASGQPISIRPPI
jgi:methylenetetrahydrofolate reductase (NADPH)